MSGMPQPMSFWLMMGRLKMKTLSSENRMNLFRRIASMNVSGTVSRTFFFPNTMSLRS
jgi:hypothetical protein